MGKGGKVRGAKIRGQRFKGGEEEMSRRPPV